MAARERYRPGTNLRAWLFTILRNVQRNRKRQALRRPGVCELGELDGHLVAPPVDADVIARSEAAEVLAALRRLPPRFAAPLHLLALEQLSYAEIAAVLEIPLGTVMSRIYRARHLIAEQLGRP